MECEEQMAIRDMKRWGYDHELFVLMKDNQEEMRRRGIRGYDFE